MVDNKLLYKIKKERKAVLYCVESKSFHFSRFVRLTNIFLYKLLLKKKPWEMFAEGLQNCTITTQDLKEKQVCKIDLN